MCWMFLQTEHLFVCSVCNTDEGEDQPVGEGEGGLRTKGAEAHDVYRRAHLVLFRVVQVVPTTPAILSEILKVSANSIF